MMQSEKKITRENALDIIKQFAKAYRKELGKVPGEIIIVGGGSIMLNYKFREATQDFDVILKTVSGAGDVIKRFADALGVLIEERKLGNAISYADIEKAYNRLYQAELPEQLTEFMRAICDEQTDELQAYYDMQNKMEQEVGNKIVKYINEGVNINTKNVDEVTAKIREKLNKNNINNMRY